MKGVLKRSKPVGSTRLKGVRPTAIANIVGISTAKTSETVNSTITGIQSVCLSVNFVVTECGRMAQDVVMYEGYLGQYFPRCKK